MCNRFHGHWSESEYLAATESTNRLVELVDGVVEVPPMPTTSHQRVVQYLQCALLAFVSASGLGEVLFAPLRVRLWEKTFREPDIVFMLSTHAKRMGEEFWESADLVMEVVSGSADDRRRDLVVKRREYAKARVEEYWIVDPKEQRIVVLKRTGKSYVVHAESGGGGRVESALLRGFEVNAKAAFDAGSGV
jgi:Uma2 family endonuclease